MKSSATIAPKAKDSDVDDQVADVLTPVAVPQSAIPIASPVASLANFSTSASKFKFTGVKDASFKASSINSIHEELFVGEGSSTVPPVDVTNVDAVDDDLTDDEEREADPDGHHRTYYHHPESRPTTLEAISSQPNSRAPSFVASNPTSRKASVVSPYIPSLSSLLPRSQNLRDAPSSTPSSPAISSIVSGSKKGSTPTTTTPSTVTASQAADATQTIVDSPTTATATEAPHGVFDALADFVSPGGDPAKPFEERFSEFMGTRGAEEAARVAKVDDIEQPAEGTQRRGSAVAPQVVEEATGGAKDKTGDAAR